MLNRWLKRMIAGVKLCNCNLGSIVLDDICCTRDILGKLDIPAGMVHFTEHDRRHVGGVEVQQISCLMTAHYSCVSLNVKEASGNQHTVQPLTLLLEQK